MVLRVSSQTVSSAEIRKILLQVFKQSFIFIFLFSIIRILFEVYIEGENVFLEYI